MYSVELKRDIKCVLAKKLRRKIWEISKLMNKLAFIAIIIASPYNDVPFNNHILSVSYKKANDSKGEIQYHSLQHVGRLNSTYSDLSIYR